MVKKQKWVDIFDDTFFIVPMMIEYSKKIDDNLKYNVFQNVIFFIFFWVHAFPRFVIDTFQNQTLLFFKKKPTTGKTYDKKKKTKNMIINMPFSKKEKIIKTNSSNKDDSSIDTYEVHNLGKNIYNNEHLYAETDSGLEMHNKYPISSSPISKSESEGVQFGFLNSDEEDKDISENGSFASTKCESSSIRFRNVAKYT